MYTDRVALSSGWIVGRGAKAFESNVTFGRGIGLGAELEKKWWSLWLGDVVADGANGLRNLGRQDRAAELWAVGGVECWLMP